MKRIFPLILVLLCLEATGQRRDEYTSKNPKAIRLLETAFQFYDSRMDTKALDQIREALQADSTFVEAYLLRANIYMAQQKQKEAIEAYEHSLHFLPDFYPNTYLTLGDLYYLHGNYALAKGAYEKFLTYKSNPILQREAKDGLANSAFADSAVKNPVPFVPVNLGASINTEANEVLPTLTLDGMRLMFTRQVTVSNEYGKKSRQEDFYSSFWKQDQWTPATPITELNTKGDEGASSFSPDGRYIFFAGCEEIYGYPEGREKGLGKCDIYISKKVGDVFQPPRNLGIPVNTPGYESQPSFSSDGRTLYFIRQIKEKDGRIQQDIYYSSINDSSKWSAPVALPSNINTDKDEFSAYIHPDNQTLYFASAGHPGMGGLDIFVSRKRADGSWGDPVNLGYPINTSGEESSFLVSPDGKLAYFASDRKEGYGGLDIYKFDLYPQARPQPLTYMKGRVLDGKNKKALGANFELIDLESGKTMIRSSSDATTGEFLVALPAGMSYALNVSCKDYLFYSENFQLKDAASADKPFLLDVLMSPMAAGERMVLKNIFFATDSFNLKKESKIELDKLVSFLKANAGLKIEISGHTDNVGDKKYNQALSEKRARSVVDYLLTNGVDAGRLASKGFGDTKPVTSNSTEQGRAENRRTEFTIVSL